MSFHHPALDFYAFLGVAGGVQAFFKGFKDLKTERQVAGTAVSKIRSMAMGTVELSGRAKLHPSSLPDPIFRRPCAYYHVTVREERGSGRDSHWVTIMEAESPVPFFLADDTGEVLIYPQGAELHLRKKVDAMVGAFSNAEDPEVDIFARAIRGSNKLSIVAYVLQEKEPVCVFGLAAPDESASMKVQAEWEQEIHALKADPARMKALDKNGDGMVDGEEWEEGLRRLRAEFDAKRAGFPPPPVVIHNRPEARMVLGDRPKSELVSALEWASAWKIIGGPILAIACGVYLGKAFGLF